MPWTFGKDKKTRESLGSYIVSVVVIFRMLINMEMRISLLEIRKSYPE